MAKRKSPKSGKPQSAAGPRPGQLTAYIVTEHALEIVKGDQRRQWMDDLPDRFAYRCLPLLIANQAGWDLLCPTGFRARWNGKQDLDAITFKWDEGPLPTISSHFGSGVLTFTPGYLFRTPKDHNMWVKGCPNTYKDAIVPLEGIIETDWAPFSFTMNWKFTRPKTWVRFEKGEPIARFFPFPRHYLEGFQPRTMPIANDKRTANQYHEWRESRSQFIEDLANLEVEAVQQGWQ
ncbi:MAG: DUF6065 family protein, partial [Acidobacteriota bacterium]|nr:DUF6065 family protein [Acidobacteriota bacterium]